MRSELCRDRTDHELKHEITEGSAGSAQHPPRRGADTRSRRLVTLPRGLTVLLAALAALMSVTVPGSAAAADQARTEINNTYSQSRLVGGKALTTPILVDDFTTGPYTSTLTTENAEDLRYQGGTSILGGARNTKMINSLAPQGTPMTLDVGTTNHLNLTIGARQVVRFELSYGYTPEGAQAPLGLDITDRQAFIVNFQAVDTDPPYVGTPAGSPPSWAIQVHSGHSYSQAGGPIEGGPGPFAMEVPLAAFTHFDGTDDSNVNFITFIFQTPVDIGIDSIELI
jgi:hypothetical protein